MDFGGNAPENVVALRFSRDHGCRPCRFWTAAAAMVFPSPVRVAVDCMRFEIRLITGRKGFRHISSDHNSPFLRDIEAVMQELAHRRIVIAEVGKRSLACTAASKSPRK